MDTFTHLALLFILWFYGILLVFAPIVLRIQFRYRAKVDPRVVPLEELPAEVREFMEPRVASLAPWNFDLVAYLSVGSIASGTEAFMALLSNPHTANGRTCRSSSPKRKARATWNSSPAARRKCRLTRIRTPTASVLFPLPQYHVFRFPQIQDVYTLYRVHRMLVTRSRTARCRCCRRRGRKWLN